MEPCDLGGGERSSRTKDTRSLLPDRDSFYHDVAPMLGEKRGEADGACDSLVLLVIDVEGLDFVLRTFGPAERDSVVRQLSERMQEIAVPRVESYHITQARFAMVLPECSYRQATRQAEALVRILDGPFDVSGVDYQLRAHVGISHYPNHARSLAELVRTGVFACYRARADGKTYGTFDRDVDNEERERFRLMLDLGHALEDRDQIRLAYQPQIDFETGRCVGVEGLCRWHHPRLGLVPPGRFLPFVEQTYLMMPLTEVTIDLGLADLTAWRAAGFEGTLAVNLSPSLFRHPELLHRLVDYFRFSETPPETVHFEVTESGIIDEPNRAINTLGEIRRLGSSVAVDDFGTGQSSLAYLADLPIDIIKIDKYFVQNLAKPWGEAIVHAAATLGNKLGLTTVAEGIEDEAAYLKCRELGVTLGQGFYLGPPMFNAELRSWLQR